MEVHYKTCTGQIKEGDFVACPVCEVRFKTFLIMERHKIKTHQSSMESRKELSKPIMASTPASSITYQKARIDVSSGSISPILDIGLDISDLGLHSNENPVEQSRRLLAESRLMYTGRRPGRPPKSNTSFTKKPLPRPPMICRQSTTSESTDDESILSNVSTLISSSSIEKALKDREKELLQREAQLKAYQEQVIRIKFTILKLILQPHLNFCNKKSLILLTMLSLTSRKIIQIS